MALIHTPQNFETGAPVPDFKLLATDGKTYQTTDFVNGHPLVIMFICNHCPYVKAIEDRLITLGEDLKKLKVNVVAISSNDDEKYIEDSYENLKSRAEEKNYPFVYLYDQTQEVALKFGAVCTPDFFVYDKNTKLAYRGRLDDSWKDPSLVKTRELYEAVLELAEGKKISQKQTPSMGCSIKWK